MASFAACRLYPFNPDRVLNTMPKPPTKLIISEVDKVMVGPYRPVGPGSPQDVQSPKTPILVGGLVSLQNLIIQQITHAFDGTNRQRLQRLIQKLSKAAQMSFTKGILQQNHIRFLMTINNEAKVRRSTKPVVLGTARIMSCQDLKEARAKRTEKEAAKGKGKRGQKRKNTKPETDGPEADVLEADAPEHKTKKMCVSKVSVSEQSPSVPVTKMYQDYFSVIDLLWDSLNLEVR